ncbi:NAD-binding protein [Mycena indigotica]|uniref:NAD-binding protein n=1 Tax=Mycena indigotica TaxID=2126181 RepID=A0A8H6TE06_9AGAR|nr:NAD-binding protein [Mycena indigotica]KAF7315666.1 NAD-binding protein [Mycena indigotica]
MSLKGRLALITGCSGGIGKATAMALAAQGCSIAVHYNSAKEVADKLVIDLTKNFEIRSQAFQADMSSPESVRVLYADVIVSLGHPDILFNNAGTTGKVVGKWGNIEDVTLQDFETTWNINTGSSFLVSLTISHNYVSLIWSHRNMDALSFALVSLQACIGGVIGPHYASSKSALHGLVHWIAVRYAKDGITCNAVAPALIEDTTMMANVTDEVRKSIPIGRMGKPDEVASIVESLITNGYLTNKIMVVDGGMTPSAF